MKSKNFIQGDISHRSTGLIFDGAADKVFNAALHLQVGQNR